MQSTFKLTKGIIYNIYPKINIVQLSELNEVPKIYIGALYSTFDVNKDSYLFISKQIEYIYIHYTEIRNYLITPQNNYIK